MATLSLHGGYAGTEDVGGAEVEDAIERTSILGYTQLLKYTHTTHIYILMKAVLYH